MKNPTFKEQYDKIVKAYLNNSLAPFYNCSCFIGNLLNNNPDWAQGRDIVNFGNSFRLRMRTLPTTLFISARVLEETANGFYSLKEIVVLENHFLNTLGIDPNLYYSRHRSPELLAYTEARLFKAMESTLIKLRELHEAKGEVIEDYSFTKRELVCQIS